VTGGAAARTEPAGPPPKPFGWRFTTPLLLGSTLNPINSSMLATGLLGIGLDFHLGPGPTASLISVLYLCSAIAQPTMGKLSTLFGPRRVFQAGILILLVAGAVGTLAPSFGFLLLSRALIGIGTSAAYPTAMALVRKRADSAGVGVPSRVLGNFSIAAQVTVVIGLPLGGVLAGTWGWRALFFVNVPLALIVFGLTRIGVAKDDPIPSGARGNVLKAIDVPGILLFAGAVTSILVFLSDLKAPVWWLLPAFVVLLVGLIVWERRILSPLIDVRMLGRNLPLQRTYARQFLVGLGTYSALYGTSQWMEQSAKLSPDTVGLILIPFSGASILLARIISGRGWIRVPLIVAGSAMIATAAVVMQLHHDSSIPLIVGMTLLFGIMNGFSSFANQASLYLFAPAAEIAVASGLSRTFSYMGAIFSSSLIGITFRTAATDAGLHALAWVLLGIGAVSVLLVVTDRRLPLTANK
jgi:predicted MFS family arabinose efflux permease